MIVMNSQVRISSLGPALSPQRYIFCGKGGLEEGSLGSGELSEWTSRQESQRTEPSNWAISEAPQTLLCTCKKDQRESWEGVHSDTDVGKGKATTARGHKAYPNPSSFLPYKTGQGDKQWRPPSTQVKPHWNWGKGLGKLLFMLGGEAAQMSPEPELQKGQELWDNCSHETHKLNTPAKERSIQDKGCSSPNLQPKSIQ